MALLPFRYIARLAARGGGRSTASPAAARRIARAVERAARVVPFRAKCIEQGLAAQLMLRRRGWAASLHYGARPGPNSRLEAHVWVRSGEVDVVGCDRAESYGLVAVFPPASR